jgi:DNA-binding transcriptional LysR family regulator
MPRIDVNRSGEMEVFVQVFDRGGFSAAARLLGITPSAVSKLVARLEARLGMQLVHRSTRKLQLTPEGQQFYESSVRVLAELDEAERSVTADATPRGRVTVNTSLSFGTQVLVPLVPRLLQQHPLVSLDIALTDRVVDLMDERADIAIRWGPLPSSELLARRLGETAQVIVGAPGYLARHGTPRRPADLESHHRLDFSYRRRVPDWPLLVDGRLIDVPVRGSVRASDGETLRQLALAGAGLARLSRYHVQADLDAGRLSPVLEKYNPRDMAPIHAVYLGKARQLPSRVRAVLDFLVESVAADPRFGAPVTAAARPRPATRRPARGTASRGW